MWISGGDSLTLYDEPFGFTYFERHSRRDAQSSGNLDFDARVPIPFSVFPSSYRSDAASEAKPHHVEEPVRFEGASSAGREDTGVETPIPDLPAQATPEVEAEFVPKPAFSHQEPPALSPESPEVEAFEEEKQQAFHEEHPSVKPFQPFENQPRITEEFHPYAEKSRVEYDPQIATNPQSPLPDRQAISNQLDVTERDFRRRTHKTHEPTPELQASIPSQDTSLAVIPRRQIRRDVEFQTQRQTSLVPVPKPTANTRVHRTPISANTFNSSNQDNSKAIIRMGLHDNNGEYYPFLHIAECRVVAIPPPIGPHVQTDEVGVADQCIAESARAIEGRGRGNQGGTVSIPCHFIRVGDVLILQGRPCQVIRITTSAQTGQHRYLGVDLFTRQLHEESSFISNPKPSVVVQSMLGPVYKTYRILDIREDGCLVAMTESGDVIQDLAVLEQGGLFERISAAFGEGRGSVRALVISDGGRELVVDYKVIHGSRL
ncbi:hypothetical protein KEM54_004184 [Ascosphaera aggregata]|nr:hypothetical protein KEM54_004184 [Ascosphaera aggregata]